LGWGREAVYFVRPVPRAVGEKKLPRGDVDVESDHEGPASEVADLAVAEVAVEVIIHISSVTGEGFRRVDDDRAVRILPYIVGGVRRGVGGGGGEACTLVGTDDPIREGGAAGDGGGRVEPHSCAWEG